MAENTSWVTPEESCRLADELHQWFKDKAEQEARLVAPKAIEYGSRSLVAIGRDLAHLGGQIVTDQRAIELAIWSYVKGKMERWTEAVMNGKPVSDDTLLDLGIYVKMAQRNREFGSWPGVRPAHELDVDLTDSRRISDPPPLNEGEMFVHNPTLTGGALNFSTQTTHQIWTINSDWRLDYRGMATIGRYTVLQFDTVNKLSGRTGKQLVQYPRMPYGYYHPDTIPDPKCSGHHNPDAGYCLREEPTADLHKPQPPKGN